MRLHVRRIPLSSLSEPAKRGAYLPPLLVNNAQPVFCRRTGRRQLQRPPKRLLALVQAPAQITRHAQIHPHLRTGRIQRRCLLERRNTLSHASHLPVGHPQHMIGPRILRIQRHGPFQFRSRLRTSAHIVENHTHLRARRCGIRVQPHCGPRRLGCRLQASLLPVEPGQFQVRRGRLRRRLHHLLQYGLGSVDAAGLPHQPHHVIQIPGVL